MRSFAIAWSIFVPSDTTEDLQYLVSPRAEGGPRVSIIMPTFRRSAQIGESIRSLLNGEYQDFELLVRDDGDGKDGTHAAVSAAAAGDNRVRYHRNVVNLGIARNLNAGIVESRGELPGRFPESYGCCAGSPSERVVRPLCE
jgi:hypothetical protein